MRHSDRVRSLRTTSFRPLRIAYGLIVPLITLSYQEAAEQKKPIGHQNLRESRKDDLTEFTRQNLLVHSSGYHIRSSYDIL